MPVFCVVCECSNRSNGENTKTFYRLWTCVVHKGGKVKKLTEKRRKKWLVNLRLRSGGADNARVQMVNIRYNIKILIDNPGLPPQAGLGVRSHSMLNATHRHDVKILFAVQRALLITFTFIRCFLSKATYTAFRLYIFCQYVCSLGIEPTTFALLTQCTTTEPREHIFYNETLWDCNKLKGVTAF